MDDDVKTWLGVPDRYARVRRIGELDPVEDASEITSLFYDDFSSVMMLQSVSGFLMTFAAPRMSRILDATGQLEHQVAKRFVDTALLFRYPMQHGLGPGPGRDAARRVNGMHRGYDIHPDDFVIIGCDIPLSALDFAERFGWRTVTDAERIALRVHWGSVSRAFGSHQPLPPTLEAMHEFWDTYLDTQVSFEPQNRRLAQAMLGHVAGLFPAAVRPLVAPLMLAQVDTRIVRGCGLSVPSALTRRVSSALWRRIGRQDPPADGGRDGLGDLAAKVYPGGYDVQSLGSHPPAPS